MSEAPHAPSVGPVSEWIRRGDGSWVLYRDGQRVDPFVEPDTYKQHEKDKPA